MPPKKSIHQKRASSKNIHSQIVPIYEILSTKDIREPLIDFMPQIEKALKQDPLQLKRSFLNMLIQTCGLEEYAVDLDTQDTIENLNETLQKAYEIKKTEISPLILNQSDKFNKEFIKRIKEFLQAVISQQVGVFNDQKVQFNQSFLAWLQILTNSKFRAIRSASIQFTKLLIQQQIGLYQLFHQNKQSKKAFNISKTISYYLQKIISQRLIDIDQSIREVCFEITALILEQLEGDILTEQLLNKIFTPLFNERIEVLDLFVKTLIRLMEKCKSKKIIYDYLKDNLQKIIALSKNTQFTRGNTQALRIIQLLHHNQPTLKLLNRDYLSSVLQTFAPLHLFYGLHAVVQVFYQSLYRTSQQLQSNSPIVLIQIINLLMGIGSDKNLSTILSAFFNSSKKIQSSKIFSIDNMFNLLIAEFYRNEHGKDVELKQKQIELLLTIINQWIKHCAISYQKLIKQKPTYEKILESFNTHILVDCKQIFFQKMPKHQQIAQKYLQLYSNLHIPTLTFSSMQNYLDFVNDKVLKLFAQDIQNIAVYKQFANILFTLSKSQDLSIKYSTKSLISKLPLDKLTRENQQLMHTQIYQISAILSKFPIQQLTVSDEFLNNLIKTFAKTGNDKEKMQILVIFQFIHHYNFVQLFSNTSQNHQRVYKNSRNKILQLYLQALANPAEHVSVKLSSFRNLTYMLRVISTKKFQQTHGSRVNAYQLSAQDMKNIYQFITNQLFHSDSLDYSSMDFVKMIQRMSLQSHQIKTQIMSLLFQLYQQSYVFACHPQSARFIISMIKSQYQLHKDLGSNSQTLSMSIDLCQQVQRRLNHFLDRYLMEQIKQSNLNRLIYWRLCYQIFAQARQDSRFEVILDKLLNSYFSKRKFDTEQRKRLTNKLMIFILHAVDKILQKSQFIQLDVYQNIFRKVARKFQKEVLIRIKEYFIEKAQGLQNNYVKAFLQTLQSVAKTQNKKSKKSIQRSEDSDQQSSQQDRKSVQNIQSDDQKKTTEDNKVIGKKSRGRPLRAGKPVPNNIMEIEENQDDESERQVQQQRKSARSQTKKKIK